MYQQKERISEVITHEIKTHGPLPLTQLPCILLENGIDQKVRGNRAIISWIRDEFPEFRVVTNNGSAVIDFSDDGSSTSD